MGDKYPLAVNATASKDFERFRKTATQEYSLPEAHRVAGEWS